MKCFFAVVDTGLALMLKCSCNRDLHRKHTFIHLSFSLLEKARGFSDNLPRMRHISVDDATRISWAYDTCMTQVSSKQVTAIRPPSLTTILLLLLSPLAHRSHR